MRQVHVDTLDAEAAQAPLELPADPLWREAVVRRVTLDGVEDLRAEDETRANLGPLGAPPLADPGLAAAAAVRVGGVERRDPELPGAVHDRERLLARLPLPKEGGRGADPAEVAAAEDEPRDLDAGAAERPRLHAR